MTRLSPQHMMPSIWRGEFRSMEEFSNAGDAMHSAFAVFDSIDDRTLHSRHPMLIQAWCAACEKVSGMRVDWMFSGGGVGGSIHPAWTETGACTGCGLNSRMRAVLAYLRDNRLDARSSRVYVAEQTTASFGVLSNLFPRITGSEYLGPEYDRGACLERHQHDGTATRVRHEDLTALTFADRSFDLVITQDVFEHVPGYIKAFNEVFRVLAPGGRLVFTIPFFYDLAKTRIRASIDPDGAVIHHHPPEIHGNPLSPDGSLCFQNFGWDILSDLGAAGFADARAVMYWGPWQGHLGFPFFVFDATKSA